MMTKEEAKNKINTLSRELEKHNHAYYVLNNPVINDLEFDMMLKELEHLEDKFPEFADFNSPTKRVGGDITKKFRTVKHDYPMLSLSNSYSKEEIVEFEQRIHRLLSHQNLEYSCEMKYDGVAISIRYKNGRLDSAITRGDGEKGEEITNNIKTIRSIPLVLQGNDYPGEFEIRGEVFMPRPVFIALNKEKENAGEALLANPRNTAAGTLKLQNSSLVAARKLDCYLYALHGRELPFNNHYDNVMKAAEWGFKIPPADKHYIRKCSNIDEIMAFIDYWDKERLKLDFDIDGVVIKVNDYGLQQELGNTAKSPRWAISYKFISEQAVTVLKSISYQVGRTGAITPVANLQPVLLGGTVVKRASLHNADQINKLDVRTGDTVFVEKGGEIIPKIVGVDKTLRKSDALPVQYINHCPECNTGLIRREGEAQHYCPDETGCPPQVKGRISHFVSRKAMDIEGLGEETVELLFDARLIKTIADIYDLKKEQVLPLERMAEKSASNLINGVEASKNIPFERVLYGLGIRHVGETVAKKLCRHFKRIENLMAASYEELIGVEEIGGIIANSIGDYFDNIDNREMVMRLKDKGLQFHLPENKENKGSEKLKGLTFVISGVFSRSRDELKELVELNGGKNAGSISGKTDYVLAGDNMGPAKRGKAEKLGVRIIGETDFFGMIDLNNSVK